MRRIYLGLGVLTLVTGIICTTSVMFAATDFNYTDAFAKSILYYEASWCGPDAGNNRLKWRGPCHTEDGADVGLDLTGGFHDAGDHVKFGLPQVYAASTLGWAYYEFKDAFVAKGQDGYMLNILKHFNDYFLKCFPDDTTFYYQCGDGTTDHSYWGPPELQSTAITTRPTLYAATPSTPASDVCGSAAASLALMYLNYQEQDEDYAAQCLAAAKKLFTFGNQYRGKSESGGFYGSTSFLDDLTWGAIWLYVATQDETYLTAIEAFMVEKGIDGVNEYCNHWTHCWDDVFGGVFVKLAEITKEAKYVKIAEENLDYWMDGVAATPGGVKYINSWGALRYTAAECMMAVVYYKVTGEEKYLNFAKEQIDYILGDNPRNSSYVVGFGNNYPKFPHHRAASGRMEAAPAYETKKDPEKHLLYGALVGGPDSADEYCDDIDEYCYTEVAIDYNAGFVGAMAGMVQYFGAGETPEECPGIEDESKQYYVEAKVMEETEQSETIDVYVHCDPLLPPRYISGLTFRYFVDLSEYYDAGMTASDVATAINYAPNSGVISEFKVWDEANHIYYVEGSWPDTTNYGTIEFQFRMANYNSKSWDGSNDYSQDGLTDTLAVTDKITLYIDGELVSGTEPSGSGSTAQPTATATATATSTPTGTVTPTVTPSPSGTPSATPTASTITGCAVSYTQYDWGGGATVGITVKNNGTAAINGWKLAWEFAGDQQIGNLWNGSFTQNGTAVTVSNAAHNAGIPAGGTVSFGFNISYSGTNAEPTAFTLNGISCTVD
ncbi:MAG: glycoside hydrolase family 9 protein [Bacillota bacterium]